MPRNIAGVVKPQTASPSGATASQAAPAGAVFQTELVSNPRLLGDGQEMAQRIDHYVANQENAFAGAAFLQKMLHAVFFGDEKIVGKWRR